MSLSDKSESIENSSEDWYSGYNVKEFIKELKDNLTMSGFGHCIHEKCDSIVKRHIIETIDKKAGSKLI